MRHFFHLWKQKIRHTCCSQQAFWVRLQIPCVSARTLVWQRLFYKLLQICKWWICDENVMVVGKSHSEDIKITAVNCPLLLALLPYDFTAGGKGRLQQHTPKQKRQQPLVLRCRNTTSWSQHPASQWNSHHPPQAAVLDVSHREQASCEVRYCPVCSVPPRFGDSRSTCLHGAEILDAQLSCWTQLNGSVTADLRRSRCWILNMAFPWKMW